MKLREGRLATLSTLAGNTSTVYTIFSTTSGDLPSGTTSAASSAQALRSAFWMQSRRETREPLWVPSSLEAASASTVLLLSAWLRVLGPALFVPTQFGTSAAAFYIPDTLMLTLISLFLAL